MNVLKNTQQNFAECFLLINFTYEYLNYKAMDGKDKKQSRLVTAAYCIVILIGIITGIIAHFSTNNDFDSLLWGLTSSCFFTVLVFTVLKFFLSNSDDILSHKIDALLLDKKNSDDLLVQRIEEMISLKIMELQYNTNERESLIQFFNSIKIDQIDRLYMIGYSMAHVFQQHKPDIVKLLQLNVDIRVMLIDPNSTAGTLMREKVGSTHKIGEPHRRTLRYIDETNTISRDKGSKVTVSKVSWIPSSTIILAKNSHENYYVLLVGINGFIIDNTIDRRLYSVSNSTVKDEKINFFETHFEYLWNENKQNIYSDLKQYLKQFSDEN